MATRLQRLRREDVFETFPFAGPAFRRAVPWLAAAILLLGLLTRVHPAVRYAVWGSDSGEYLYLTERLVETGRVLFEYDGWGIAYPYFPGMFLVAGATHEVIGVDVFTAVQYVTPVLAALVPLVVGLLAYRVTSDPRAGVVTAAFLAVTAAVVITTSHAMPGTLGQLFYVTFLALLPDAYRKPWHAVVLALLGGALVLTHHLTTYFLIGTLAAVALVRELIQERTALRRVRVEAPFLVALTAAALAWWLGVATPFREHIIGDAVPLPWWATAVLGILALGIIPGIVALKRRRAEWHKMPRYPDFRTQRLMMLTTFAGILLAVVLMVFGNVPGTFISVTPTTIGYVMPVVAWVAFLPLGVSLARFYRQGTLLGGWLVAILGSLAFAVVTGSRVLFPFRHVDYMVMAMAPFVAIGMLAVYDQSIAARVPMERPNLRKALLATFFALVVVSATFSLPPRESIGGFEEGVTREEMNAIRYVRDNPAFFPPGATFAADHRISSLLWGIAKQHPTWDFTPRTYHSDDAADVFDELASLDIPAGDNRRIDHVFLSPTIEAGVTLLQWENSDPMTGTAIAKFDNETLFHRVYEEDDVRIYRVRWENAEAFNLTRPGR